MIPKKIFTTWVSDKPYPEQYKNFLDGWKKIMPDYEITVIGLDNIKHGEFVDKYLSQGKFAVAGHYARVQELYENGGLYFDIDIEAIKSFDDLLDNKCFIGREDAGMVNNAVIGSVAGEQFLKSCLDYMDNYSGTTNIELETGPWMFNNLYKDFDIKVFPEEYFYPFHYTKKFTTDCVKENTHTIHWWGKTWEGQ